MAVPDVRLGASSVVTTGAPRLLGCDFSSSPNRKKQIVLAEGRWLRGALVLQKVSRFSSLDAWQQGLSHGDWVGGFDLPFGLPRPLVQAMDWPTDWQASVGHFCAQDRADLRLAFKAFCAARPVGGKFAHRATDGPAGASPSMKWVNPPVAWMLHAGVPRLLATGAAFPAHRHPGAVGAGTQRVALEAYPGLLARELLGGATSYKSDDVARQTPQRTHARQHLLNQLVAGQSRLALPVVLDADSAHAAVADASGDTLDALLALVQAAWCWRTHTQGHANWGLPDGVDPLEGWIATA